MLYVKYSLMTEEVIEWSKSPLTINHDFEGLYVLHPRNCSLERGKKYIVRFSESGYPIGVEIQRPMSPVTLVEV